METTRLNVDRAMAFLAVAQDRSITRAAQRLGSSKANISKQVKALEEALAVKLLHRESRQLRLTEAGEIYLDYCRRISTLFSEADRAVLNTRTEVAGLIRMSVPNTFGVEHMASFIQSLHVAYPLIELELDLSAEQRDLISGRFDLALRSSRTIDSQLIAKSLGVWEDWLVASPAFLEKNGTPSDIEDLAAWPCLCNSHMANEQTWRLRQGGAALPVAVDMQHWLKLNHYGMIRQAALSDLGIARLPVYMVGKDVRAGVLERVLPDCEGPAKEVSLVFPDQRPLPHKVRVTIDHFESWYKTLNFGGDARRTDV